MKKAIAYIFNDTLVCDDADTAKRVTFHNDVRVRSVTLEGDVYDPSGTLSGGSAPNSSQILVQVQELLEIEGRVREAHGKLQGLMRDEAKTKSLRDTWRTHIRDLEIKQHELKLLEEQIGGSNASLVLTTLFLFSMCMFRLDTFFQNANEVEKVKSTIENLREALQNAKQKQKEAQEECKKLERDMDEFKNNKDGKIEELKVCANIPSDFPLLPFSPVSKK